LVGKKLRKKLKPVKSQLPFLKKFPSLLKSSFFSLYHIKRGSRGEFPPLQGKQRGSAPLLSPLRGIKGGDQAKHAPALALDKKTKKDGSSCGEGG